MIKDESALWDDFIGGDDKAFSLLFNEYVNKLFVYGMNFTYNEEIVKDCIQDLFMKLYVERKKLKPVSNIKVYLFNAMKNTLFNLFRKEIPYYQIDSIEPSFYMEFSPEHYIIEGEIYAEKKLKMAQMFKSLTPRQLEALYYRYVEELSYDEICKLMQMNYQSVRNLLHRAISKLKS